VLNTDADEALNADKILVAIKWWSVKALGKLKEWGV
jgi:hypothetical protein